MAKRAWSAPALGLTLGLALAGAARSASASESFPPLIAMHAGFATPPPCGVCHAAAPNVDPVTMTPFGQALRQRGFTDITNLAIAFDLMAAQRVDSDGDKAIDTDELSWGGDPNGYDGPKGEPAPEVQQGFCGVGPAPGATSVAGAAWALGLVALVAGWRRRRAPD